VPLELSIDCRDVLEAKIIVVFGLTMGFLQRLNILEAIDHDLNAGVVLVHG
jgi:hypothetical protein